MMFESNMNGKIHSLFYPKRKKERNTAIEVFYQKVSVTIIERYNLLSLCCFFQVVPMSIFIFHCIDTLLRMLKSENHCKLLSVGNHFSILSHEVRFDGRPIRRIIQSVDLGIVLLGCLKVIG